MKAFKSTEKRINLVYLAAFFVFILTAVAQFFVPSVAAQASIDLSPITSLLIAMIPLFIIIMILKLFKRIGGGGGD